MGGMRFDGREWPFGVAGKRIREGGAARREPRPPEGGGRGHPAQQEPRPPEKTLAFADH